MHKLDHPAADPGPLVSVSITAFNSERWLPRALDSVLRQRTNFPIEVVVGDDHSRDGTVAVARSYEERNPLPIRVLERDKNLGMQRNYYETFEQCRGKYIAWLDADDYWTDPEKLAIQVQLMESDPSVSACGHLVRHVTQEGNLAYVIPPVAPPGRYELREIVRHNFVPSPSIMFRNGIHRQLPECYFGLPGLVDWPILVLAALSGDIVLLDRMMADSALTPESAYSTKGALHTDTVDLEFCKCMEGWLPAQWSRSVRATRGKLYESMAYTLRKQGDYAGARRAAYMAWRAAAPMDNFGSKTKALLASVVGPWVS
jgi:glycosyltransferase involved in cell wall biosynthesis